MSEKIKHVDVVLEYSIPASEKGDPDLAVLRVHRPKTRHIIQLTIVLGPDLATFIASSDGGDAKEKLAALKENENIGALLASLVTKETLEGLLEVLADLCGITPDQAGEIDLVDQMEVGKALIDFFPALKLMWPSEPQGEPQT